MDGERLEDRKIEEEFVKGQGDITESELKRVSSDIEKAIEETKKTQKETREEKTPRLIWVRRLVGNEPPWPHPRGEKKLSEVLKKLDVDIEEGRRIVEDKTHPLYQQFEEEQKKEERANSSLERRLITIKVQETNEPGIAFARIQWWLVSKEEKTELLITEYSLYSNLETKKEPK